MSTNSHLSWPDSHPETSDVHLPCPNQRLILKSVLKIDFKLLFGRDLGVVYRLQSEVGTAPKQTFSALASIQSLGIWALN
jgi:hypothetical protein